MGAGRMTKEQYMKLLTQTTCKTADDFFPWLEESPDFMELTPLEIEINFMMYSLAFDAYCLAAHEYTNEY
jgi:hypothetical protein